MSITLFPNKTGVLKPIEEGGTGLSEKPELNELLLGNASGEYELAPVSSLATLIDHSSLLNLSSDDHTQYHNDSRALAFLATRSTDDLPEGSNLYYTNERVDDQVASLIQDGTGLAWTYVDASGILTGNVSLSSFSTTDLSEGSNLYFTDERVDDRVSALIQDGTGLTWTYVDGSNTFTGNVSLNPFDSDDLSEGSSNLYFTSAEKTKLSGIETGADVTDANNVEAAGAIMDSDFSTNGLMVRTGSGSYANRSITGKAGLITVIDGDGVSDDPEIQIDLNYLGQFSIITVGTLTNGTWRADTIETGFGGTGQTSYTDGQILIGNSTGNTLSKSTLTSGTGVTVSNGSGSITLSTNDSEIDHGSISGLSDDDHPQYSLANGSRSFTGTVGGIDPVSSSDLSTKNYVDTQINTINDFQKIYESSTQPQITTDSTRLALTLRRGSSADSDKLLKCENGSGTETFSLTAAGNLTLSGTVDGRDILSDGTKLDTVESNADVTDATNVAASGAVMDSDFSNNGFMVRTIAGSYTNRDLLGSNNNISVSNGDGLLGNPTFSISSSYVGQTSITTVGTIATGTWEGSTLAVNFGGTGQTSYTNGQILIGNTTGNTLSKSTLTEGNGITITNGSGSITISANDGEIDHGSLLGLSDDDHSQYALLTGRSGGQSLIGGTGSSEDLVLESTSNSTKGSVFIKSTLEFFTDSSTTNIIAVDDSLSNKDLNLDAKGTGTIFFGKNSGGNIGFLDGSGNEYISILNNGDTTATFLVLGSILQSDANKNNHFRGNVGFGGNTNPQHAIDSSGNINSEGVYPDMVIYSDQKSLGTSGGTFTSGAWRTRDLNNVVSEKDDSSSFSLSSNQITLQAGTYLIEASAPAEFVDSHQTRFQNITDSSTEIIGTIERARASGAGDVSAAVTIRSVIRGVVTISSAKTFELQHRCQSTQTNFGFGFAGFLSSEVYSIVKITKLL